MLLVVFAGLPTAAASSSCPAASSTSSGSSSGARVGRRSTEGTWTSSQRWAPPAVSTWRRTASGFRPPRGCVLLPACPGGPSVGVRTESVAPSLSGNHRQHGDVGRQDCPRGACADPKVSDPEVSRAGAVPGVPWAGLLALLLQARGRAAGAPATSYLRLESGTGPRGPSQSRCRLDFCTGFRPQWV